MNTKMPPQCDCCHALLISDKELEEDRCCACVASHSALQGFKAAFEKVSPKHHQDCLRYVRNRMKGRWNHAVGTALNVVATTIVGIFVLFFTGKALLWLAHFCRYLVS